MICFLLGGNLSTSLFMYENSFEKVIDTLTKRNYKSSNIFDYIIFK